MPELTFHLEDFEGPLDLLLSLVAKHKMDLHNIPILELIDQYTQLIGRAQQQDPDVASAFIEMAARLVEMKSVLLLPRSTEGERMKEELTGQLIEYELCRTLAACLKQRAAGVTVYVRAPLCLEGSSDYPLHHSPQLLADCWQSMAGRTRPAPPKQEIFEPLVSAPVVSVESRVVRILRGLITGRLQRLEQLFDRRQDLSTAVATFLALLELMRAGRVELGPDAGLVVHKGRLPSRSSIKQENQAEASEAQPDCGTEKNKERQDERSTD